MYCQSLRHGFMRIALFTLSESNCRGSVCASSATVKSPIRGVSFINKMPKKEKTSKNTQMKKQSETPTGPVSTLKDGGLAIAVHAKPGAKQNAVTDVSSEAVGVAIAAPPTDGEANAELVRYLCKVLALKKSEVMLDKGSKSREKVIKVTASISQEEVLERLKREAAG
ncbi:UPF0235 protein C15orf40 homolog [Pangasianodon hypophthalmus]|uniref:UPF0235 protein C15orf40 homolog n=1 Tax=Pangasianodon hypophthalmus TaxID=310915 RepID=UPI002307AA7F|nr:UPF0235 protein C15orf40 homolog [Pangasianodon hypophthalmus]